MTASKLPPRSAGSGPPSDDPESLAATPGAGRVLLATTDGVCEAWANAQAAATGWVMDSCPSAEDAVRRVLNGRYSALLLDDALGGGGAARATQLVRAWEGRRRRTYIVALLDPTAADAREELLAAGADECVRRVLDSSALWEGLKRRAAGTRQDGTTPGDCGAALDPNVLRSPQLIRLFLEQIPEALAELGGALERQDADRVRAVSHKLKGSSFALGAWAMAGLASELQGAAERHELAPAPALIEALQGHFDRAAARLRAELTGAARSDAAAPPAEAPEGAVDGRSEPD